VHGFRCYDNIHICKLIALYTANAYRAEREIPASACTRCHFAGCDFVMCASFHYLLRVVVVCVGLCDRVSGIKQKIHPSEC